MGHSPRKVSIVTGATSGIGFHTALKLAYNGHEVLVIGSTLEKATYAADTITLKTGNTKILPLAADLAHQVSISNLCQLIKERYEAIDVLIHNAGTVRSTHTLTPDAIETQFAVNHLSSFIINHHLLPTLKNSENGRIIFVNSRAHARGTINKDNIFLEKRYTLSKAYNQSKLANMMYAHKLHNMVGNLNGITVNTFHPGLVNTDFGIKNVGVFEKRAWQVLRLLGKAPENAIHDAFHLATAPEMKNISGKYFYNLKPIKPSKESFDVSLQDFIWQQSLQLTHIDELSYGK